MKGGGFEWAEHCSTTLAPSRTVTPRPAPAPGVVTRSEAAGGKRTLMRHWSSRLSSGTYLLTARQLRKPPSRPGRAVKLATRLKIFPSSLSDLRTTSSCDPPPHCILYLQHCTSLLTRAQLTSFLDGFLGPASPGLQGGQWQWLDQAGVWCDLLSLPENTPVTQRFPIQIYFDTEDQAAPTITALRQVGFLSLEHNLEQLV